MSEPQPCRFCRAPLSTSFADLGVSPVSNAFLAADRLSAMEPFYPLHALVCDRCFLVQLADVTVADPLFSDDYAYFSSFSESWLAHARRYAEEMVAAERLGPQSLVVEIASNDGYLLQYFAAADVPVLGVEPAANTARVALAERGVPSEIAFFGRATAERLRARGVRADLIVANNVLAHVPDLNDFVSGVPVLLKPGGVATFEFPHLLELIRQRQFDTIYHEHFSYLSFGTVRALFAAHGLRAYDVTTLPTHGGSLRVFAAHADDGARPDTPRVAAMLRTEQAAGLRDLATYRAFADGVVEARLALLDFLIRARREGRSVVGYGAPAKGNTLLNYCGVKLDLLPFTVDRSPHKIGRFLPGTRIPVLHPDAMLERRPDYVLILPWNLQDEITAQMAVVRDWGGRFVVPVPTVQVLP